jgi:hypothetical protein
MITIKKKHKQKRDRINIEHFIFALYKALKLKTNYYTLSLSGENINLHFWVLVF